MPRVSSTMATGSFISETARAFDLTSIRHANLCSSVPHIAFFRTFACSCRVVSCRVSLVMRVVRCVCVACAQGTFSLLRVQNLTMISCCVAEKSD